MQFNQVMLQSRRSTHQIHISTEQFMYVAGGWLGAVLTVLVLTLALRTLG